MKTVDNFINPIMPVILDKNFSREEKFQAIKSIMLEWKSDLCKQQREICKNNVRYVEYHKDFPKCIDYNSILNAPEPE